MQLFCCPDVWLVEVIKKEANKKDFKKETSTYSPLSAILSQLASVNST